MLGQLTRYFILSLVLALSMSGGAQTTVESLKNSLVEAANLRDSISILYQIYDYSPSSKQGEFLEDIYELALRHKDYPSVMEVLKHSSYHYASNDSMQEVLIKRAEMLPDCPEKQGTLAYLRVKANLNTIGSLSKDQREVKLREYLAQHTRSKDFGIYDRIEYLCILCSYLRMSTDGVLLTNYLKELQPLIDSLPEEDLVLKLIFYRQASKSYLTNRMVSEAVDANKKLLVTIDQIKKFEEAKGWMSHEYENLLFSCYSRLLRCHNSLSSEEIEEFYKKILPLLDLNPELQGKRRLVNIYYLMAKKRYAEALPLIKAQLNDCVDSSEEQLYLLDALLKASETVGSKDDLLMALDMNNEILKDRIKNKASESYKELQIIYDVNDLQETNNELMEANQQIEMARHNGQFRFAITSLIVLLIILIVMFVLYRRSNRLNSNLRQSNSMIIDERDNLQLLKRELMDASDKAKVANQRKNDFINNLSHEIRNPLESIVEYSSLIAECVGKDKRKNAKRYADVITLNSDLLLTLVNDVLEVPSLENAKVSVQIVKSSVQQICSVVIDNVKRYIKPDVELVFTNEGQPDVQVMTDPNRVEQVLLNLLMNAAKFTEKGCITLEYNILTDCNEIVFTVTDTGIGIPQGKEEMIFSRFEKHDSNTQGGGLGLYISRLIAEMLGGAVHLDKGYSHGAKFIFTIPVS